MSKLQVFSIKNSVTPTVIKNIKPTKKIIVPSLKDSTLKLNVLSAASVASALTADSFIKRTKTISTVQQAYNVEYEQRGRDWYRIYIPCDGSGGKHEIPCRNPYEPVYYPSS